MLSKLPWLISRRRLLILVIIDYLIILFSFLILQQIEYLNTNFIAINILAFCWIIISYSLDKYSLIEDEYNMNISDKFFRLIKTSILCGVIYKIVINIFSIIGSNVGDGKWLYFISIFSIISFIYELIHSFIIKKYFSKNIKWISIFSNYNFGTLFINNIKFQKYGYLKSIHISELDQFTFRSNNNFGFILEDINLLDDDDKKTLINLKNRGFKILSLTTWLERYLHRYPFEFISSNNIFNELLINKKPYTSLRIKRFSEFTIALLLIVLSSPIILIAGIFIKIEDNGPILYRQTRTGFGGVNFTIFKLRSMNKNAEKDGIKWTIENDKRITKIGAWLRKTRIDELPQLFSVLTGDMSLIGPRPERPEIDEMLTKKIPNYKLRYLVRPGLSGWAQVNYPYGASVEDTKMKFSYDIYYIKNLSTFFDILIFLETIRLVLNFRGSEPIKNL
tara:strand:+ start:140 stop:1486 length:1347 start_codon:yes stop_codon:yes gene_type:complete